MSDLNRQYVIAVLVVYYCVCIELYYS